MKKLANIFITLLMFIPWSSFAQVNPNYRNVFWVHGIQGDVNSLKAMSDYFNSRYQINSYHLSYTSNRGIVYAANQINGFGFEEQENDIVIAHSMGGLVTRQHYKQAISSKRFGGLISLNSPHLGAEFANSFDNGKIATLYQNTISNGLVGYKNIGHMATNAKYHKNVTAELNKIGSTMNDRHNSSQSFTSSLFLTVLKINSIINFTGFGFVVDYFEQILKGYAQQFVALAAEVVCGDEEEYQPWSKNDLKPNSTVVTNLNNTPLPCPKIAIGGVEEYPAGIRFLGSQISLMRQSNPGIGDITDNDMLNLTNAIAQDSRICQQRYSDLYSAGSWWSLGLTNSHYAAKRDAFKKQAQFWENGFEREYQKCLGSIYYTTETITVTEYVWVSNGDANDPIQLPTMPIIDEPQPYDPIDPGTGSDGYWQLVTRTYTVTVENIHPNDGIVTLPSQLGLAGATTKLFNGTNHEEAKRSEVVALYLENQFDHHPFFKTPRK